MASTSTVLIIDDEINLRRSLSMVLQRSGYAVTTAGNAQEVFQYLQAGAFDLVFLDLKMPDINGLELLLQIRRIYPNMPVMILTAHATLESAIEAVRRGARDYLLKPIDPAQIVERVQEILAESEQTRRRRMIMGEMQQLLSELHKIEQPGAGETVITPSISIADPARILKRGVFTLDLHTRGVTLAGKPVPLSPTAFDYLATLMRHSPNAINYEQLVMESQGYKTSLIEAREISRWRIHELRKVIEPDTRNPEYIITVRGTGYRLVT